MSARHRAELAELNALVLEHVTRYPGLSSYEIARAKRLITAGGNVSRDRVLSALLRLLFTGAVAFDRVRWPAPGGHKIIWYAVKEKRMAEAETWLEAQPKNTAGKVEISLVIAEGNRRGYCICPKPMREMINFQGFGSCLWCGQPETRQSWEFWYGGDLS